MPAILELEQTCQCDLSGSLQAARTLYDTAPACPRCGARFHVKDAYIHHSNEEG